ncbi:hypothetical protein J3Q64DRAFT_1714467 [Phycomyces blakesleeanus]|uniref:SAGA-associated factor 11 n=1 Tax=Phycomyces blakesleeanus TaxID=4837 RepID=A0ABR3BIC5_PHYBL
MRKLCIHRLRHNACSSPSSLFRRLLADRNRTLDELQQTHATLQKSIPKLLRESESGDKDSPKEIPNTKATLAFALFGDLIDECIYDVLSKVHRDTKRSLETCQLFVRPNTDIFGNHYNVNNLPSYKCMNCESTIASTRYATHLERCLGLAGRQSGRVASRRLGSSPNPSNASDDAGSSNEYDGPMSDRKRKKTPLASTSGSSRVKKLKSLGNE